MEKEEFIYDSTKNKEYYKRYLSNKSKEVLAVAVGGAFIISLGIYVIISSLLSKYALYKPGPYLILIFLMGIFLLLIPPLSLKLDKRLQQKGLLGVQLNGAEVSFLGRVEYFRQKKKHWRYEDIDFVFIDENIGFTVIKTIYTPKITADPSLLRNPKKFWSKIPWKDRYRNSFDTKMISDLDEFIRVLRHYGVPVYRRREASNIIEVVE